MLSHLVETIRAGLGNQVASGMLLMGSGAAIIAYCRSMPGKLWTLVQRQFMVTVDIQSTDELFSWLAQWLDAQPYSKNTRRISAKAAWVGDSPVILFTPAPGNHWFFYKGRLLWFERERKEIEANKAMGGKTQLETVKIRMLGRSQQVIRDLLADARKIARQDEQNIGVYVANYGSWHRVGKFLPRPIESVFLPDDTKGYVVADLKEFLARKEWYRERGIPWRRGYLLSGLPGSGKSSLVSALSGAFGLNLYMVNLASVGLSDEGLTQLLLDMPEKSAVLFEDIDAVLNGREVKNGNDDRSCVTFSGLLNALDGITARSGQIVFLTSNHPEKLDPALLRPGRVDLEIKFSKATENQIERLFQHFYGGVEDRLAKQYAEFAVREGLTMAEVQQQLLQHKDSPHAAVGERYDHRFRAS